ncbi:MAG: hypothetical protein AABY22_32660 [Nanoarchaeota archaeon]
MNRTKKQLINELVKIKKELKLIKSPHKNRKTFISLEEAEKRIRKVPAHIFNDFRGTEHIQCRINLPACYANKYVKVITVRERIK